MDCEEKVLLGMLAAFIDGEGTIGIGREVSHTGKYGYWQYISVNNTDIRLINWLLENFGGSFMKPFQPNENSKICYRWSRTSSGAYKLNKKIRPFLIIKQEQADLAIELYEKITKLHYGGGKVMPSYKRNLAEGLYQKCKYLNRRGLYNDDVNELESEPKLVRRKTITLEDFE